MTHGVSSMTLQMLAMVLRQSVVFSSGRVLFYRRHEKQSHIIDYFDYCFFHNSLLKLDDVFLTQNRKQV